MRHVIPLVARAFFLATFLLLAQAFLPTPTQADTLLFSESFESYAANTTLNGQNGWVPAVTGAVWKVKSLNGGKRLNPTTTTAFHQNLVSNGTADATDMTVVFDFRAFNDGNQFFPQLWLHRATTTGDPGGYLIYQWGNTFYLATHSANSGAAFTGQASASTSLTAGTVYRVEATIAKNVSNQQVITLWVYPASGSKGSPLLTWTDANNLFPAGYVAFGYGTWSSSNNNLWIDNVSVTVPEVTATAPSASNVSISGIAEAGQTLTGSYAYSDLENNPEDTSTFRWLSSNTQGGTYTAISGATNQTYMLQSSDLGQYIKFEVTPVATVVPTTGDAVLSTPIGPVADIPITPSAPQNLVATAGDGQVILTWNAPSSEGSSAITDYVIEYKESSAGSWITFSDGISTALTATVTSLTNGVGYDFRVSAVNTVGVGQVSASVSVTPIAPSSQWQTVFSETFDSYVLDSDIGGQNNWTKAVSGAVWQIKNSGSSQVLSPTTTTAFHQNIVGKGSSIADTTLALDFKAFNDGNQFFPQLWLRRTALTGDAGGYLIYQWDNSFVIATHAANSGGTFSQQASANMALTAGTVYRLEASVVDNTSGHPEITLWVYPASGSKGSPLLTWTDTADQFLSGHIGLGFGTWTSPTSDLWIDNVTVSELTAQTPDTYYHILSTGQSLSVGYNSGPALTTTQPYNNLMLTDGVEKTSAPLIPLVEAGTGENGNVETPSSAMANTIRAADSEERAVIVSLHGHGGAPYNDIKKGTSYYNRGITQVTNARGYVINTLAGSYKPLGVTITHGETDYNNGVTAATYQGYMEEMQNDYETDINALTGASDIIPLFLTQMNAGLTGTVAVSQLDAHRDNPGDIILVGPKYQMSYAGDHVHLTNSGSKYLGELMGKVIKKVADGQTWNPLMPTSISRASNIITVSFAIPTGTLAIDTTTVAERPDYGFEFAQTGGNSISITDVQLINNNTQAQITLSATPTGANQRLRYAYTCTGNHGGAYSFLCGDASDGTYVGGNIRDTDTTVSGAPNSTGLPLYNWLVAFDEPIQ